MLRPLCRRYPPLRGLARPFRRSVRPAIAAVLICALAIVGAAPPAAAHAELLQASPAPGSIVGGEFHSIVLHFGGIDWEGTHEAKLFGPDGAQIVTPEVIHDRQRLVIPLEPLTVPGTYRVRFTIEGDDNDVTSEEMSFRFDPAAAPPAGVTLSNGGDTGFDWVGFGLLVVGAALLAFLVARFMLAYREHQHAKRVAAAS